MAEEVSTLMKATVLMRQPGRVQEIVGALRKGGGDRLQVISDFDMTLSRFAYNGKRCPSSYNILDNSKIISEECRKELKALLHHYYPIEIDPHRTIKEKLPHMVEWDNQGPAGSGSKEEDEASIASTSKGDSGLRWEKALYLVI